MRNILILVIALLACCVPANAQQPTYNAASASFADVNDCINGSGVNTCTKVNGGTATHTAVNGDIINVPSGTVTWNNQLVITACIQLLGNGTPNSLTSQTGAGTINTNITDGLNSSSTPLFSIHVQLSDCPAMVYGQFLRISSLSIVPCTGVNTPTTGCAAAMTNGYSPFNIVGTCTASGCPFMRIDNVSLTPWNTGTNGGQSNAKFRIDGMYGVLDHDTCGVVPGSSGQECVNPENSAFLGSPSSGSGFGDSSFHQPFPPGDQNQLYIENNFWDHSTPETEFPPLNTAGGGARFVLRFNVISGWKGSPNISWHGLDTGGRAELAGQAAMYGNSTTCLNATECSGSALSVYNQRDGNLLGFLNQVHVAGGATQITSLARMQHQRSFRYVGTGTCGGTSPYDANDGAATVGTGTLSGVGGLVLTFSGTPWTANAFNFPGANLYNAIDNTTGQMGIILSNTANTITLASLSSQGLNGSGFVSPHTVTVYSTTLYNSFTNTATTGANLPINSGTPWTTSQWVSAGTPFSMVDVSQGFTGTIQTNSTSTITYEVDPLANGGSTQTWTNGDSGAITRSTQCWGQPDRAQEQLITSPSLAATVPSPFQPVAISFPFREFADTVDGGVTLSSGLMVNQNPLRLQSKVDYWMENQNQTAQASATSPFDGTTTIGVGHGTLANRPTTCTTGVAYFATDQGSWNQSGGANPVSWAGQGRMDVCTSTNTWTNGVYAPYTYPHPLIAASAASGGSTQMNGGAKLSGGAKISN